MSRTKIGLALAVVAAAVLALVILRRSSDTSSAGASSANEAAHEAAGSGPERAPGAARAPPDRPAAAEGGERGARPSRRKLDAAERTRLLAALEKARSARLAAPRRSSRRSRPAPESTESTDLDLKDKTGDDSDWERRQVEVLNQLLGECYDLAKVDDPTLEGKVALQFTLTGEPEVGGVIEDIRFVEDGTTIESPDLRECLEEQLYALELDPPPDGISVSRQITLDLGPD